MKILNKEISASSFPVMSLVKKWQEGKFEYKLLIIGFVLFGIITFMNSKPAATPTPEPQAAPESVDTFIPHGLVLIPLEIANAESLGSIIGTMGGVVDLYLSSGENRKGGILVAKRVKLIRAPRNPEQFAVLVRESEGQRILKQTGPFLAVVQNPDVRGSQLTVEKQNPVRIEYSN